MAMTKKARKNDASQLTVKARRGEDEKVLLAKTVLRPTVQAAVSLKEYTTTTPRNLRIKIKDLQERDKDGLPRYRKYRDGDHPVYGEPPALAFLEKVRGENWWTVWVWVAHQMVTDSLLLLSSGKPVYLSLQEKKENRQRQIRNLGVQTTDPAEE